MGHWQIVKPEGSRGFLEGTEESTKVLRRGGCKAPQCLSEPNRRLQIRVSQATVEECIFKIVSKNAKLVSKEPNYKYYYLLGT